MSSFTENTASQSQPRSGPQKGKQGGKGLTGRGGELYLVWEHCVMQAVTQAWYRLVPHPEIQDLRAEAEHCSDWVGAGWLEQNGKQGGKFAGSPPQVTVTTVLPSLEGEEDMLVPRLPQSASY